MSSFTKTMVSATIGCIIVPAIIATIVSRVDLATPTYSAKPSHRLQIGKIISIILSVLIGSVVVLGVGYYGTLLMLGAL